jgi:hypothetical protein
VHLKYQNRQHWLDADRKQQGHKVKKRYQISNCKYRFSGAKLTGIKFNVMQNMIVNNESK